MATVTENGTADQITDEEPFGTLWARVVCVTLVMLLALAGNTTIIAVIVRTHALRNITGLFLVNLAVADLCVTLFSMPFVVDVAVWGEWRFSDAWCTGCGFMEELFTAASIATLAVISYDRHVAIVKPLHYQQLITPMRAGFILMYIWIQSTVLACLPLFHIAQYSYVRDVGACTINWKTASVGFTIAINLFGFFTPLFVILICYAKIFLVARKVKRQVKPINPTRQPPSTTDKPYMEMDNFSMPANFGIQYEDRKRTIMFTGNLQIAESSNRAQSASTGHVSRGKPKTNKIVEETDVEGTHKERLHGDDVRKIHNCEIKGNLRIQSGDIPNADDPVITFRRQSRHLSWDRDHIGVSNRIPGCLDSPVKQYSNISGSAPIIPATAGNRPSFLSRNGSLRTSFGTRMKPVRRTLRIQRLKDTKAATTLLILLGAIIVCWTPYVTVCFLVQSGRTISSTLYGTSFVIALCNSAINVFVYGILNTKFRKGFKSLFQSCYNALRGEDEDERRFPNNISQSVRMREIEIAGKFLQRQNSF